MTVEEIKTIRDLQQRGLGYKKIATLTGLPVNSVKTLLSQAQGRRSTCRGAAGFLPGMRKTDPPNSTGKAAFVLL